MGRARNNNGAVIADGFAGMFGQRRGVAPASLAGKPGAIAARAEVNRLCLQAQAGDLAGTLRALSGDAKYLNQLDRHPALAELAGVAAQSLSAGVQESVRLRGRALLTLAGAAPYQSTYVARYSRGQHSILHIWPRGAIRGADFGPLSLAFQRTLCGREFTTKVWSRAARGAWGDTAAGADTGHTLCADCVRSSSAGQFASSELRERSTYPLFDAARSEQVEDALAERALLVICAAAQAGESADTLPGRLDRELHDILMNDAAEAAHRTDGWALQNVLDLDLALKLARGAELTADSYQGWERSLTPDDWKWALSTVPGLSAYDWGSRGAARKALAGRVASRISVALDT